MTSIALIPLLAVAAAHGVAADECAVFMRELSFAQSVADRDEAAFKAHLASDAVFGVGTAQPLRGPDAIVTGWRRIVQGDGVRVRWYPRRTTVSGDLAWSTGPALWESLTREPRVTLSEFQSVWRRSADGEWRVVFDTGTAPKAATPAEVDAFRAAMPTACPAP